MVAIAIGAAAVYFLVDHGRIAVGSW